MTETVYQCMRVCHTTKMPFVKVVNSTALAFNYSSEHAHPFSVLIHWSVLWSSGSIVMGSKFLCCLTLTSCTLSTFPVHFVQLCSSNMTFIFEISLDVFLVLPVHFVRFFSSDIFFCTNAP